MKTPRWIQMRKRSEPELPDEPPIWLGNHSNGEYFHLQTEYERKLRRFILQTADNNARKVGVSRRDFLASAMGMATSLWCINVASGCSSNETGHNIGPTKDGGPGGPSDSGASNRPEVCSTYKITPEMMYDQQAACAAINGNEFIFDIQTHFFETDGEWNRRNPGYVSVLQLLTGTPNFGMNPYLNGIFCNSDTKMAVLSCWPGTLCISDAGTCGLPMSTEGAAQARDTINLMAKSQRMLSHAMILPNDPSGIDYQKHVMEVTRCTTGVSAWKLYPAANPPYFMMDDPLGIAVIEQGIALGVPLFCIHKGLPIPGFDPAHLLPTDIGPVAKRYPNANFIVYHASINAGGSKYEGPYVEGDKTGVNALITSMKDNGIGPNENVCAELGSSWRQVMNDGIQAAHYLGKLMKYVGEDNICWGTDYLAAALPQPAIIALRNATIPADMQAQYGYVELTTERKAKIFGLNSARLYGVDEKARHCQIPCPVASLKEELDGELGDFRWAFDQPGGPQTIEEYVREGKKNAVHGSHS